MPAFVNTIDPDCLPSAKTGYPGTGPAIQDRDIASSLLAW
jgi:hypothetical protein